MVLSNTPAEKAPLTERELERQTRNQDLEDLDNATSLVTKLEKQRKLLNDLPDTDPLKKMKLFVNQKAIKKAARIALQIAKIPSDSSSIEEESSCDGSESSLEG